ncbi:hypothetical protein OG439_24430 [Amycolatopsis sp. NBC_01307]|uniref:hypothetical protein n=1 Tax=Amycolatopsis sp. NBC_01307 TaxID=2903561 RepID=UPI002E1531DB|nr:hypothetical protein OG439_24430 [Amycolatopsis sp. NBC_01307]
MTVGHFPPAIVTLCASSGGLLPGVPAGAEARRVAAEVFADMSPARLTDLLIMVDELVTDAERHGSRLREVHLCRFDMPAAAHIEVVCTPAASPLRVEPAIAAAALGRLMVEELAVAWGVQREGDDWMTWAEV